MEEERIDNPEVQEEQQEVYTERPAWQLWLARIGLVIFLILYYVNILRGGL